MTYVHECAVSPSLGLLLAMGTAAPVMTPNGVDFSFSFLHECAEFVQEIANV